MPEIGALLKSEIRRLARKEAKLATQFLQRELKRLKSALRESRNQMKAVGSRIPRLIGGGGDEKPAGTTTKARFSGKNVRDLRKKLGLSQAQMAKLVGVSSLSIYQWERTDGRLKLRERSKKSLLEIRGIGKREAHRRLEDPNAASGRSPLRANQNSSDEPVAKRGPGRPPKSAAASTAPKRRGRPPKSAISSSQAPKRRGRPPKSLAATMLAPKRRGRPPKSANSSSQAPKRRGRPPKNAANSSGLVKRGPGRPRKNP